MAMSAKEKKEYEKMKAKAVSLNPEDMDEGGGLLDNIRGTITKARFVITDYGGKAKASKPAAHLIITESDGTEHDDQYWSVGKAEDWTPSDDGHFIIPTGVKTGIHKSSNFGMIMQSILDSGFPGDKMSADITFLEGTECHLLQQVVEGRDKIKSKDGSKEYDPTVLCVAEIFSYPWEKKGKKTGGGKKKPAAKKGKSKTDDDDDSGDVDALIDETAAGLILEILAEEADDDGTVELPKKSLGSKIMQKRKGEDAKETNVIVKMAFNDEFLSDEERPWTYENGVLSM